MSEPESLPLENVDLLIQAYHDEGRDPVVISHGRYWSLWPEQQRKLDYLVLQDDTYKRWVARDCKHQWIGIDGSISKTCQKCGSPTP